MLPFSNVGKSASQFCVNIRPQIIQKVEGIVAQEINGNITYSPEEKKIRNLIEEYGGEDQPLLETGLSELKDTSAPKPGRVVAKQRLKKFMLGLGDIACDARVVAEQANSLSEKANNIAMGVEYALPSISLREFDFDDPAALTNSEMRISIWNKGDVLISGFLIEVIPLSGLIYEIDTVNIQRFDTKFVKHRFIPPQVITKNAHASINIYPLVAEAIKTHLAYFDSPSKHHKIGFNVVVSPIIDEKSQAIETGQNDRQAFSIEAVPEDFSNFDYLKESKESEETIRIFAYR